jgi:hypothetical protein
MIIVKLDIDNKTAHSCSPIEFLTKYILQDAHLKVEEEGKPYYTINTPYATITVKKIVQV